jgi:hypothetical protein
MVNNKEKLDSISRNQLTGRHAYHTREASLSAPRTIPNLLMDELPETSYNSKINYYNQKFQMLFSYLRLLMSA